MTWKRVCSTADVAVNSVKKFEIDGVPVVVVNYGKGFRVLPPICPHMEEPLDQSGVVVRCALTCTKHLWAWNLETLEMQGGETEKPLKTYEMKEEDGAIFVNFEGELTYDFDSDDGDDDDFFK